MSKVSLGSFGAFPIFVDLVYVVSRKQLIVERHGRKFGPQGQVFSVHRVRLTVKCLRSVGVIRCISDFCRPCILETDNRRAKRTKNWSSGGGGGGKSLVY